MKSYGTESTTTKPSLLVIGYGNSLRRDDGAGLVFAQSLIDRWRAAGHVVEIITAHQLNPELAEDIAQSGAGTVLFVDAAVTDNPQNAQIKLTKIWSADLSPSLGHHLDPAAVLLYAKQLYGYEGTAWTASIPGFDWAHGEGLSDHCRRLIDEYVSQSDEWWCRLHAS